VTRLLLVGCLVVVGLLVPSAAGAAPVDAVPLAGAWTDASTARAHGARAVVTFSVDAGTGLVQPTVRYRLRRCAGVAKRFLSEKVQLGSVAAVGGAFVVRDRHRHGKARVALRLRGVFDTSTDAHGSVRGKVKVRLRGRRRAVVCTLPKLTWSTSLAWADEDDEEFDEGVDEGSDEDDDEFDDDEEFDEDDDDPGDDEDVDPDEDP
jgi:hypothetical protein